MDEEFKAFLDAPDLEPGQRIRRRGFGRYSPFNWAVAILLLTGFAFATWIGSFYTFSHPENPRCYKILQALHKVEEPKRFEITAAPLGRFYTARELYDNFLPLSQVLLDNKNDDLLRDYLQNYSDRRSLVPYLSGHFTTLGLYELRSSDVFPSGVVAVAQSVECPQVLIEHVYPTQAGNVPKVRQMLATNPEIILAKTFDLTAVVHAEKLGDGRVLFTVMPISYGNYAFKPGISSTFRLDPPRSVHLEAGLPLVKHDIMPESVKMFAQYRKTKGLMAKVKVPELSSPSTTPQPQKSVAYSWVTDDSKVDAPADTAPAPAKPEPMAAPAPVAKQTPIVPVSAPEVPADEQLANATPPATAPVDVHPAPVPAPLVQPMHPGQPLQRVTIAQPKSMPSIDAPEQVTPEPLHPVAVAHNKPTAVPAVTDIPAVNAPYPSRASYSLSSSPAPTSPSAPAAANPAPPPAQPQVKPQKLAAAASLPPAPTPTIGKPLAHPKPTPNVTDVIASMHAPAPKSSQQPYVVAKPVVITTPPPMVDRAPSTGSAPSQPSYTTNVNTPAPRQLSSSGVPLQPFLTQRQQPVSPQATQPLAAAEPVRQQAAWRTYAPGQMPRGKLVDWPLVSELATGDISHDRYYLRGKYVVTASSDNRIILRPQGLDGEAVSSVRIVVDFPTGTSIPQEGAAVSRGQMRPFEITEIRRGNDGQLNVYAREITSAWTTTSNTAELLRSYHSQRQRLTNQYSLQ